MKRVSLFLVALIVLATTASAQVKFGGKAGINLAKLSGKSEGDSRSTDSKVGLHIGALAEIPVSENFSVQPELNFDQWGGKESEGSVDFKENLTYISVPVLAKATFSGFGIYAGPQINFLASAKIKAEDETEDIKDAFKGTDFGAVFGVEYNFPMGIFATARYNLGLSKITDESTDDDFAKNRAITVAVGIKFGGGSGSAHRK